MLDVSGYAAPCEDGPRPIDVKASGPTRRSSAFAAAA